MIGKLFCYEITKKWRSGRNLLMGYAGVQILLLIIIRVFLWNRNFAESFPNDVPESNTSAAFILTTMLFFALAAFLGAYPFIEGIYRFERDLSGKQAYLELMIPATSWKKVLAKLLATLTSLVACGMISLLSFFLFFAVNTNFFSYFLKFNLQIGWNDIPRIVLFLLYLLFSFASFYMITFLCISIAKSFTHKNKIAVPIGILAFIITVALIGALTVQVDKIPLIRYSILDISTSLSTTLEDILLFIAAMAGTSWLMEKKIEH